VDDGTLRVSYAALEDISGRVASVLIESGLRPGDRAGILIPRSAHAMIGFYGALKARAAYVPLDPDAPDARLEKILDDAGATHLLATPDLLERAAVLAGASRVRTLVEIGGGQAAPPTPTPAMAVEHVGWQDVLSCASRTAAPEGTECDLAYLLYTS